LQVTVGAMAAAEGVPGVLQIVASRAWRKPPCVAGAPHRGRGSRRNPGGRCAGEMFHGRIVPAALVARLRARARRSLSSRSSAVARLRAARLGPRGNRFELQER